MADTKVEIEAGRAQWRIECFMPDCPCKRSQPFKLGIWNWYLTVERKGFVCVRLFPQWSPFSKEPPPLAKFSLRVTVDGKNTSTVHEGLLRTGDDFAFHVGIITSQSQFVIDVEFSELKIWSSNGGESISIWPNDDRMKRIAAPNTLKCFSRMLNESLYTDITINTVDGRLRAHKAVLCASSPVFHTMFRHDLRERRSSIIDIEDMTSETCTALLGYIYGNINYGDFWKHRFSLLAAADKYGIAHLKDACDESLVEDIDLENVLDRLQEAWLYQLGKLKKGCVTFLLGFGKNNDIREYMKDFLRRADRDLVVEIFQEVFAILRQA